MLGWNSCCEAMHVKNPFGGCVPNGWYCGYDNQDNQFVWIWWECAACGEIEE